MTTRATGATRRSALGNLEDASEIVYLHIPKIEQELAAAKEGVAGSKIVEEEVGAEQIAAVISAATGIPAGRMLEGERERLLDMEGELGRRIIGQDEAVLAVSNAVRRARAGLSDPKPAHGQFSYAGADRGRQDRDGEVACRLSVRRRLGGASHRHVGIWRATRGGASHRGASGVCRLRAGRGAYRGGAAPALPGRAFRRGGEGAPGTPSTSFLQLLDEGHLTDGQGRRVNFANAIILFTSNIGAEHLLELEAGADSEDAREVVMAEVRGVFRPELLNRLDEILLFHRLAPEHMRDIVSIQFAPPGAPA